MVIEKIREKTKEIKDPIKAIIVFGSVVRKEKARDVDVLIVLDDSVEEMEKFFILERYRNKLREIEKEEGVSFHFQDPMRLSELWIHLLKAMPWVVTAIDQGVAIYDPDNIVPVLKKFVRGIKYVFNERAEKLIESAEKHLEKVEEMKIDAIKKIGEIALEGAKLILFLDKKFVFEEDRIIKEIKNYRDVLGKELEDFLDIMMIYKKVSEKKLTEVSMADIDRLKEKLERFLERVQKVVLERLRE